MKKININKFAVIALVTLGTIFASSCSKEAGEETILPGMGTRVVISVEGIDNGTSGSFNKIQASAGKSTARQNSNDNLIKGDAFDVLISQPASISQLGLKDKIRAAVSTSDALKSEVPMTTGNAYRVFLRKQGEATLTSAALTSGTAGSISVEKGATYEWFAVSYNSTTAVPEPTSGTDVELSDISSLLYAKGEFAVGSGEGDVVVPLAIVFKPRVTKAVIEINTMGMFAPVASAIVNVSGLYAAPQSIDILTGDLTGGAQTLNIAYDDFAPVDGFGSQRLVAEAYVAGNSTEPISVTVSDLSIMLDNGSVRNFENATLEQTFNPEAGMEQNIVLNFLETPIRTSRDGTTVDWARSNLYYENGFNAYRFFHTNPFIDVDNTVDRDKSFFAFRGHIPRQFASSNIAEQKDPCALVYPAGRWRTPTDPELRSLTTSSGLVGDLLGNLLSIVFAEPATPGATYGADYIQYASTTAPNPAYTDATNNLRFNYNGLQNDVSLVSGLVDLSLGQVGEITSIWSSDRVLETDLLNLGIGVGAWGYLGATAPPGGVLPPRPERAIGSRGAGVLNIDAVGLGVVGSGFQNVRCVRDNTWSAEPGYNPYPVY